MPPSPPTQTASTELGYLNSSPQLLGIETSTRQGLVVIGSAEGVQSVIRMEHGPKHGRLLVPAIQDALAQAGLQGPELAGIAVGLGPGSFTGTRIGVTAAKTLAFAWGLELLGIETPRVLVQNAPQQVHRATVVNDAQRGEIYVTDFDRDPGQSGWSLTTPTRIVGVEKWLRESDPARVAFGPDLDALRRRPELLGRLLENELGPPRPEAFANEIWRVWRAGSRVEPATLEPIYMRRSSAEENWLLRRGGSA
jgi:tRNA threonylcarbamoyladenosine biosynthesis protein TsaB